MYTVVMTVYFIMSRSLSICTIAGSALASRRLKAVFSKIRDVMIRLSKVKLSRTSVDRLFRLAPERGNFCTRASARAVPCAKAFITRAMSRPRVSICDDCGNGLPDSSVIRGRHLRGVCKITLRCFRSSCCRKDSTGKASFKGCLACLCLSRCISNPNETPATGSLPFVVSSDSVDTCGAFLGDTRLSD